jgi:hypothetical protein
MQFINDQGHHHGEALRRPHGHQFSSVIVSGDSDQNDNSDSEAEYSGDGDASVEETEDVTVHRDGEEQHLLQFDPSNPAHADELYDRNLDEEDEAYVYRHMRGGIVETVTFRTKSESSDPNAASSEATTTQTRKVLKPRYSDAVLSCPCCFNIVCMDCQRHQRYPNQFRAMFVMGITVDWQSKLIYDEVRQVLVPKPPQPTNEVPSDTLPVLNDSGEPVNNHMNHYVKGEYFPVLCQNCGTQVASLDMVEEIYHFHGCLESS